MVNPSTAQARVVVDELIRGGVRDVVLCPGSRNAPLAFALQDADRAGRIRLHVRIDERTAGFLAIGLAVAERAPVCVAMTSGTAVANLGPAVVEANYARVPLIVLSANRPYELLGTGANQTFEQLGYFGTQVRANISLGLSEEAPDRMDSLNAQWRSATCRVLVAATGSRSANAGPVQFDIPLREPLVPDVQDNVGPGARYFPEGRPGGKPWTHTPPVTFDQPLDIDLTPDTVVIAGHGAGAHPNLAGLPTVAEPTAPPADNPLHPFALRLVRPQQVIMLGRPTLHRPVSTLLADPAVPVFALTTGPRWPDVSGNSQATGTRAVTTGEPNPAWLKRCAEVNQHAVDAVRDQLAAHPLKTGLHVAAAVADAVRPGDQLVLGASNPVRDAALVGLNAHGHQGAVQPRCRGYRRDGVDGDRRGAGPRRAHHRADRRPDVRSRQLRTADRADRADTAQPDHRGVQRQWWRHLRTARAGRPAVLRRVVADLRHAPRCRRRRAVPGLSRREPPDRGRRAGGRAQRAVRRDAGAGGEGRPVVAAGTARVDQGRTVSAAIGTAVKLPIKLGRKLIPRLSPDPAETRSQRIFRRIRIGIVLAACLVTLQSVLMVMGAWRNDRQIERHMGVAAAEVLSAGPRRSTIEFVTPDRVTYRPELGVLYPSELETGMRIYVEYDTNNPDLVRVQDRNASLAIIPAGSIAVVGWLIAGAALFGVAVLERRRAQTHVPAQKVE